jgi:predicted metal-dependent hydrolase
MGLFDRWKRAAPPAPEPERFTHALDDLQIPVLVVRENRPNSRVAFGRDKVTMRISLLLSPAEQENQIGTFREWIDRQLRRHPERFGHFRQRVYHHGETLEVGGRRYTLAFAPEAGRQTITGRLHPATGIIRFQVPAGVPDTRLAPHIERLLSRIVGAHHLPEVQARVHELNEKYFRQPLGKISLKYNHSNWGSCSSKGNINLSTRLLFAPPEVLEYVIVHELAHRIEMNHSPRFWALVAKAMPGYEAQERWLREHGGGMRY